MPLPEHSVTQKGQFGVKNQIILDLKKMQEQTPKFPVFCDVGYSQLTVINPL